MQQILHGQLIKKRQLIKTSINPVESIADITGLHGFHQIINQPTHFYPGKNPSCIELIFCSQPNLISESGVLLSLLPQCHHDIIFAKIDMWKLCANIFSNFCPHKTVTCSQKDAPWMTSEIKEKLKEKTKIYKKYVKNKYDIGYKQLLTGNIIETSNLIINTKEKYYKNEGKNLLDPSFGQTNIGLF